MKSATGKLEPSCLKLYAARERKGPLGGLKLPGPLGRVPQLTRLLDPRGLALALLVRLERRQHVRQRRAEPPAQKVGGLADARMALKQQAVTQST